MGKASCWMLYFVEKQNKENFMYLVIFSIWKIHIMPGSKDTLFFKALRAKSFSSFIFLLYLLRKFSFYCHSQYTFSSNGDTSFSFAFSVFFVLRFINFFRFSFKFIRTDNKKTFVIDLKEWTTKKHIWLGLMRDSMDIKKSVHIIPLLHHGYLKKQAALKNDSMPWCRKKLYVYITTIKLL